MANRFERLTAESAEMTELLKHAQVIAHCEVLYNLAIFQAKSVNVLNFERLAVREQTHSLEGRNELKFSQMRSLIKTLRTLPSRPPRTIESIAKCKSGNAVRQTLTMRFTIVRPS